VTKEAVKTRGVTFGPITLLFTPAGTLAPCNSHGGGGQGRLIRAVEIMPGRYLQGIGLTGAGGKVSFIELCGLFAKPL
jgi:hypothetical protein